LLLLVCAMAWLLFDWIYCLPGVEAVLLVQPGMTEEQVIAVFGTRPTKTMPYQYDLPPPVIPPGYAPGTDLYWYCDAGIVAVNFGPDGRVRNTNFASYDFQPNPTMVKVRSFLRQIGIRI
jgi:hypothetical protein